MNGTFTYISPGCAVIRTAAEDIPFTPPTNNFLEGDIVSEQGQLIRRTTAQIVGVIKLEDKKLHGHTKKGLPIYTFIPLSWHFPIFHVASSADKKLGNQLAIIQFQSWDEKTEYPTGTCIRLLGPVSDNRMYDIALMLKNGLADNVKAHRGWPASAAVEQDKPDFKNIIVIDPAGSTDCDDGFDITEHELHVHIADVDYYFPEDGPYEQEIRKRATSIYSNSRVYHMLPEEYASDIISLNKHGCKRTLTVTFHINDQGAPAFKHIRPTLVKVAHSLTYEQAQDILDTNETETSYLPQPRLHTKLKRLAALTGTTDTHKMIERIMIWTNEVMGKFLYVNRANFSVYCPEPQDIPNMPSELRRFGPRAEYSTTQHGHGMMGLPYYTHFTSPIRRYADLVVHRLIKNIITGKTNNLAKSKEDASHINTVTSNSKRYYRDLDILKLVNRLPATGVTSTTGYVIDFAAPCKVSVYLKEYDIVIHTTLFHANLSSIVTATLNDTTKISIYRRGLELETTLELYKETQVNIICFPSEIRINKKISVSFPIISSAVLF